MVRHSWRAAVVEDVNIPASCFVVRFLGRGTTTVLGTRDLRWRFVRHHREDLSRFVAAKAPRTSKKRPAPATALSAK